MDPLVEPLDEDLDCTIGGMPIGAAGAADIGTFDPAGARPQSVSYALTFATEEPAMQTTTPDTHAHPHVASDGDNGVTTADERSFVRAALTGIVLGVVGMAAVMLVGTRLGAAAFGWEFSWGVALYVAVWTGGFFGGVIASSLHLIREEAAHAAPAEAAPAVATRRLAA
ncbi:MAG: hypothetical protein ACKVWR_04845 [Acidimicrobiales bacterium]